MLGLWDSPIITVIGLCVLGFGSGMIIIPILPEMLECVEEFFPEMDEELVQNNLSGLFIAF